MLIHQTLSYYKRKEIREAIVEHVRNKEVGVMYKDKRFGKRPEILQYESDVLEYAQKGAISFHASEEIWNNPLRLRLDMTQKELDDIRVGWDLILDLDCKDFEYSRITALEIIKFLKEKDVKTISVKFSGSKGFHIGVPWEAMPEEINGKKTKNMFPDLARKIAFYIREAITEKVGNKILEYENYDLAKISEKAGISKEELFGDSGSQELITKVSTVDVKKVFSKVIEIDTIVIAPRHLYRVPYSLNEKTMLVSLPIPISKLKEFSREDAKPSEVVVNETFLEREKARRNEMEKLIREAMFFAETEEFHKRIKEIEQNKNIVLRRQIAKGSSLQEVKGKIDEEFFPEPIKRGLAGLADGKKRFLFILMNFLANVGWQYDEIVERVREWNKKNPVPLKESYIKAQLKYLKQRGALMPPNYDNEMYYRDIGLIKDQKEIGQFKNPVNHAKANYLRSKNRSLKNDK